MKFKDKVCKRCGTKYIPTGSQQMCCVKCGKIVRKEYEKKYRQEHRKETSEYGRKWREKNKEKLRERAAQYFQECQKDPKFREYRKRKFQEWRKKNKEKYREQKKRWRKNNPKKVNFMNQQRYWREQGVKGSHTFKEWELLKKKFNYTCPACGRKEPEIKLTEDHIVPISKGGTNNIENIQPLCGECNSKKYTEVMRYDSLL